MAHCFVEFGAYGAIGDFDTEDMTEEEILENIEEIIQEFTSQEAGYIIVDNKEDY
jgi:hypothetical protein